MTDETPIPSPCVHICYLNDDDICQGCFRSGDEITAWMRLDNDGRRQVMANVAEREKASPFGITMPKEG